MPKIFCVLFEGEPVRYIRLRKKKTVRTWFFHADVMAATRAIRDDLPDEWRMTISLTIAGECDDVDLISLEGVFFLAREAEPRHAARFLAFLAACGIGGRP